MDSPFEKKSLFQRTNSDQLFKKKKMNHFYKKKATFTEIKSFSINSPNRERKRKESSKSINPKREILIIEEPKSISFTHLHNKFIGKSPKKLPTNSKNNQIKQKIFNSNVLKRNFSNISHNNSNKNHSMFNIDKKRTAYQSKQNNYSEVFGFLEEPVSFDDINIHTTRTNFLQNKNRKHHVIKFIDDNNDNDENVSIYSITNMKHENIIKLNELQKEFKKSFIGFGSLNSGIWKKSFLMDMEDEMSLNEGLNQSSLKLNDSEDKNRVKNNKDRFRVFQRTGNVYDSLDEEDIIISTTYIHPDSKLLKLIDFFVFIFSIFNLIYIPFFLALNDIHCRQNSFFSFLNFIEIITNITYLIDAIIPFFSAYYTLDDILKTNLKEIGSKYLKSYFIIDFLAAIPFRLIFQIFDKKCEDIGFLSAPLYQNNVYYCLLLLKVPKAIKAFSHNRVSSYISNILNQCEHFNKYFGLYSGCIIFFTCLHLIACSFIFIGKCQYPGWIVYFQFENKKFHQLYLIAIYYIITTCTTVGYGDLTCITLVEKIFGLIMEIVGIFAYSFAISSISNYVKVMNDKNELYREKIEILEDIKISYSDFSEDLYTRIHRFLKFKFNNSEKLEKKEIINSLPITLKNALVCEMYRPLIQNFIFFKYFDNIDFIVRVILSFKPILAVQNDVLLKEGDFVEDMIFVKRGRLSLDLPIRIEEEEEDIENIKTKGQKDIIYSKSNRLKKSKTINTKIISYNSDGELEEEEKKEEEDENIQFYKILYIQKNEHFGDILMFLNKRSPLRLKVKSKKAELFYLNKEDAFEISQSYSQIWKKINKKSLFNWEQIKRLMKKVAKIFTKENNLDINNVIYFTTDIPDVSELQSIPSLTNVTLEDDERELYKSNQLVRENTLKNKDVGLNFKESTSIDIIEESQNEESKNFDGSKKCDSYSKFENSDDTSLFNNKTIKYDDNDNDNEQSNYKMIESDDEKNTLKNSDSRKKIDFSEKYSENSIEKNYIIKIDSTPYKPNEINNEIYPDEIFVAYSKKSTMNKESTTQKLQKLLLKKNLDLSVCSTEISFSINREYENLEELSDYKYSKNPVMQRKVKEIIGGNQTYYKSSLKSNYINNSKILKKKTSFIKVDKARIFAKKNTFNQYNDNYKIDDSDNTNKEKDNSLKEPTIKKNENKKKNLLNVIHQNIERNYMNLNDPNLFYNEFFQKFFEKRKEFNKGIINKDENPFDEDDEEILKKFDDIYYINHKNKSHLQIFNAIKEKL